VHADESSAHDGALPDAIWAADARNPCRDELWAVPDEWLLPQAFSKALFWPMQRGFDYHWPGVLKPGLSTEMIHVVDYSVTLTKLVGANTAKSKPLDGFDVWPTLAQGNPSPRHEQRGFQKHGRESSVLAE
jgi:hypothetical protein